MQAYTLGGSVTYGRGATSLENSYAHRLFDFIRDSFPNECAGRSWV